MDEKREQDFLQIQMSPEGKNLLPAQLIGEEIFFITIKNSEKLFQGLK